MHWNTQFQDPEVIGNYIEAGFCATLGLTVAIYGCWRGLSKNLALAAGFVFLVFGCSDVVEAQTGAWYRPLWLLAWKALCLLLLAGLYLRYRQLRRANTSASYSRTSESQAMPGSTFSRRQ